MGDLQQSRDSFLLGPIPRLPDDLELARQVTSNQAANVQPPQNGNILESQLRIWKEKFFIRARPVRNKHHIVEPNGTANLKAPEGNGHGGIQAVPKSGSQKLWPNAEKSLGDRCDSLASPQGKFQCWQIVGDAKKRTRELQTEIRQVLGEYSDEIHKGGGVAAPVVATIFMIGKNEKTACPTLIICGQKKPRRAAMKKIREGKQLDNFRQKHGLKVMMAERDEMPLGDVQRVSGPGNAAGRLSLTVPANLEISYNIGADIQEGSAVQLYIKFGLRKEDQSESKATVGCLLSSDGKYFAWTAAHPFFDLPDFSDDSKSTRSSDLGFAFDSEYGYETDDQESDVPLTGTSRTSKYLCHESYQSDSR
jgi:hypothetical protein